MSKKQPSKSAKQTKPKTQPIGWIWPKDPQPGNPARWSRFKRFSDVLSGKGPDVYFGTIGKYPSPTKDKDGPGRTVSSTNWARWDVEPEEDDTPFPWARRGTEEKYDYNTRKYGIPNEKTWSAVEYADCEWDNGKWRKKQVTPKMPIRFWDKDGRVYWCQDPDESGGNPGVEGVGGGGPSVNGGSPHGCHCCAGLHERDSAIGSHEHLLGYAHPIRTHCSGCCCHKCPVHKA